ncbi:MAG: group 1 truncated hemoglobin [Chloroflexi bacterium]|nr:group 1 truncated hemoglobin [Chloroflexota bacterium]
MQAPKTTRTAPLFERLKGEVGLAAIVDDFYTRVLADPLLQPFFAATDMKAQRRHQALFLRRATGGPAGYQGRSMAQVHAGLHLTDQHFDAVCGHLDAALQHASVSGADRSGVQDILERLRGEVVGH